MPEITYLLPDGSERTVDVPLGRSVMDGAVRNNLPGIVAECGGSCSCATCHVFLDEAYQPRFDEPTDDEQDLLAFRDDAGPTSRLSCQLIVTERATGSRIRVSATNG